MDNPRIIHAPINIGRRYAVTTPITQYDYGYLLLPEGVELPTTYEIDFSNDEKHGTSLIVYGDSEGAEVPEELIRTGKDVYAFYYHVGDGYGKTEFTWRLPNKCRPSRDGQTPTPSQQSSIDQLIVRSNEAVESAEQSASDASASAQSAQGYAEQAEDARDTAQGYANNAQTSANNASASASQASTSATASAQSASQSAQIKSDVEDLVEDAQGYANASAQSASASANSASQAQGFANSASASAQSASGYASQAQTSAQTASAKAQDASGYAQTATQKATESAQSASQALSYKTDAESAKTASQTAQGLAESARDTAVSAKTDAESARDDAESARDEAQQAVASISGALDDKAPIITDTASGSIASFPDGADNLPLKSLVVNIDPIQDLHGQENPYPAGGGKNKFNGAAVATSNTSNWGVTWDDATATLTIEHKNTYSTGTPGCSLTLAPGTYTVKCASATGSFDINKDRAYLINCGTTAKQFTVESGSTYTVYFSNANASTFTFKEIQIEAGSTATAYAPYENICPISGLTQVDAEQKGKNLLKLKDGTYTVARATVTVQNGTITVNGESTSGGRLVRLTDTFLLKAGTYNISHGSNTPTISLYLNRADNNTVVGNVFNPITITEDVEVFAGINLQSATYTGQSITPQLELGSTATPYEPYTGRSITINLGQTVYGGKLDVLSGELTIDMAEKIFSGEESEGWYKQETYNYFISTRISDAINEITTADNFKNNTYPYGNVANVNTILGACLMWGDVRVRLADMSISIDDWKNMLSETPLQVCYRLATPITIQLTPNQVNSLLGVNNIWADSGDTEVVYRADTKAWVQRKITEAVAAALNS